MFSLSLSLCHGFDATASADSLHTSKRPSSRNAVAREACQRGPPAPCFQKLLCGRTYVTPVRRGRQNFTPSRLQYRTREPARRSLRSLPIDHSSYLRFSTAGMILQRAPLLLLGGAFPAEGLGMHKARFFVREPPLFFFLFLLYLRAHTLSPRCSHAGWVAMGGDLRGRLSFSGESIGQCSRELEPRALG